MQQVNSQDQDSVVKEWLTCVWCNRFVNPPILQCGIGHLTCENCYRISNRLSCFKCKKPATDFNTSTLCRIIKVIDVKCSNTLCQERVKIFGEITCPNVPETTICNPNLPIHWNSYLDHLIEKHGAKKLPPVPVEGMSATFAKVLYQGHLDLQRLATSTAQPGTIDILEHGGISYIVTYVRREDIIYIWVSTLLPECEVKKLKVDFFLLKDGASGTPGVSLTRLRVAEARKTFEELKHDNTYCVWYPIKILANFCFDSATGNGEREFYFKLNFAPE